jgi:hypothetical protein
MNPKDQAREWLDNRCGREVHVETHLVNASEAPQVHEGRLTKSKDPAAPWDLYEVGLVSYNLADLPDDIEVQVATEPAEKLEMTFGDGASLLITVVVRVI